MNPSQKAATITKKQPEKQSLKEIIPSIIDLSELPAEIRLMIYEYVVGRHLIHIYTDGEPSLRSFLCVGDKAPIPADYLCPVELSHKVCQSQLSEADIYASYSRPVHPDDNHAKIVRSREDVMKEAHAKCDQGCYPYDLSTLIATHESKQDAVKSLYSGNTFSFNCLKTFKEWLTSITPEKRELVRTIRLVIICRRPIDEDSREHQASGWRWRQFFADEIKTQLPNLRLMNLVVYISGPVSCWRRSQAAELNSVFEPLRDISLRKLTIVIDEFGKANPRSCVFSDYDEEHRGGWMDGSFWERRELKRAWAEEIRGMVLRKS